MSKFKNKKFYRLNQFIQAQTVRAVDEKGKQVGVMSLNEALEEARKQELDLVEIAPKANPPVVKIIDFKKFKYLEAKKESSQRIKKTDIKEIRLTPFMASNDFQQKIKRAAKFLKDRHQVKISVFFKGRLIAKKEFGYNLIEKALIELAEISSVQQPPKFLGRYLVAILNPNEKSKKDKTKN